MSDIDDLNDAVEKNHHYRDEEPGEEWRKETPEEKITWKFDLKLIGVGIVIVLGMLYLFAYVSARDTLYKDFSRVSAGYATAPNDSASIAKGLHVATTRGCQDCHGKNYGGVIIQDNWKGRIVAPNLTAGNGSAVKNYYDDDWIKAIKHGVGPDGKALVIMPSTDYAKLSDSDLLCMIAYLKNLPPVNNKLPKRRFTPFTYIDVALGKFPPVAANIIDHSESSVGEVKPDSTVAYGQYISTSCTGCHGNNLHGGVGPNLTASGDIDKWSYDDFHKTITEGVLPNGHALKEQMPWKSFSSMNDIELTALFKYLKSLK